MTDAEKYKKLLEYVRDQAKLWLDNSSLSMMEGFSRDGYERIIKARMLLESIGEFDIVSRFLNTASEQKMKP